MATSHEWTAEDEAVLQAIVARVKSGLCPDPECPTPPQYVYQVHQAMYAYPCQHRMGVGNARKHNERYGRTTPESAHRDPEYGLYSDWVD